MLLCRRDDDGLLGYDLTTLNGKTIGVYERAADKIRYLKEFLAKNDLECRLRYYKHEDMEDGNLYQKLREGEVDMLLGNNLEIGGEFRMVASFQAQPYYIVTTAGNSEVLEGLNMALRYINVLPVTRESDSTSVAFAIPRPVTPELLTILNKAISNIPTEGKMQ